MLPAQPRARRGDELIDLSRRDERDARQPAILTSERGVGGGRADDGAAL